MVPGAEITFEPESFLDSEDEDAKAEFEANMKEMNKNHDKLRARLLIVLEHRRELAALKMKLENMK